MTVGKIENSLERGFVKHRLNCLLILTDPIVFLSMDSMSADNYSRKFDNAQPKKQSFGRLFASFKNIKFSEVATIRPMPEFIPNDLWPKRAGRKSTGKKRGSVTYSMDRENEVRKVFIISLWLIGCAGKEQLSNLAGRRVQYGPQN